MWRGVAPPSALHRSASQPFLAPLFPATQFYFQRDFSLKLPSTFAQACSTRGSVPPDQHDAEATSVPPPDTPGSPGRATAAAGLGARRTSPHEAMALQEQLSQYLDSVQDWDARITCHRKQQVLV